MPAGATGRSRAYSPQTNVMYVQLQNLCADYRVRVDNIPSQAARPVQHHRASRCCADGSTNIGRLDAISVETGKTLWSWETPASNYSPVLATAGGVLFNGSMDRYLRAFDQNDGKVLWQTRLGIAGVRRARDLSASTGGNISRWRPAAASTTGRSQIASRAGPAQRRQHGLCLRPAAIDAVMPCISVAR